MFFFLRPILDTSRQRVCSLEHTSAFYYLNTWRRVGPLQPSVCNGRLGAVLRGA